MSEPRILKAIQSLAGKQNEKLKVRWRIPEGLGQPKSVEYLLSTSELTKRVDASRAALDSLQGVADLPSEAPSTQALLTQALQQLARSGRDLYELLMSDVNSSPAARAFRDWFERDVATSAPGTWRVEFQYQGVQQPAIPWGLVYSGAAPGNGFEYGDYIDFWAHRYSTVSYVQSADSQIGGGVSQIDGEAVLCSLLIEVSPDNVDLEMAADDGENLRFRMWGPLREHAILTVRDLRDRFRGKMGLNHIVYLNLRTDAGCYKFPDEPLTPNSLGQIADYLDQGGGHAIAMIDREAVIRGDRGQEWLYTFFNAHWAGLIAAETDIKAKELQHQGFSFLTELLECGVQLSQSLPEIRKKLWPYSLLYGVYSNPDNIFVAPPPQVVKEMRAALKLRHQGRRQ